MKRWRAGDHARSARTFCQSLTRKGLGEAISKVIATESEAAAQNTKTISLGQTTEQVEAILGKPDKIVNLGPKTTYVYKDMKVVFQDGKVADIQ